MDAGGAEKIEGELSLGEKIIPEVHGKLLVGAAKDRDEVILERADCAFGGVATVVVWGYELVFYLKLVLEDIFDRGGGLVVESVKFRGEPTVAEVGE